MRIAVVGGTGQVGNAVIAKLESAGHEAIVVARSKGVDVMTGEGLDEALTGADAVIDVSSTPSMDPAETAEFFGTSTANQIAAEQRAGVGHHVLLSIVGIDRAQGNPHYVGKLRQEEVALAGDVPVTILRATQFHNFPAMAAGWTRRNGASALPPLVIQPVDIGDVAGELVAIATAPPEPGRREIAGPDVHDMLDLARRTFTARGESVTVTPSWKVMSTDMAGDVLLPGPDARIGTTTFDDWLAGESAHQQGPAVYRAAAPNPIDPGVTVGHVHLRTADIDRIRGFYVDVLGFSVVMEARDVPGWGTKGDILFVSAGGYHHHIGFNTWKSAGGPPQPDGVAGLHHIALRYPTRAALADALRRLRSVDWPIRQATDHGTHDAIYITDPDGNDVELMWDRPFDQWPHDDQGHLTGAIDAALDLDALAQLR
jgi:catechol 2,3-dioxygenase